MQLDGRELLLGQRPALPQHGGGHPELARIVQHPGVAVVCTAWHKAAIVAAYARP